MRNWREGTPGGTRLIELPDKDIRGKRKRKQSSLFKALECLLCFARYSNEDILNGTYNIETFICSFCYERMQQSPHNISCFGKPTFIENDKRLYGYQPESKECNQLCPDREICKRVVRPDLIGIETV